jgi:hypothetical protein
LERSHATIDPWTYRDAGSLGIDIKRGVDLAGFSVEALGGSIGKIDEATYDLGASYVVVDTGPWIFGKKVMLPAALIQQIDLDSQTVFVDRTKDEIKNAPEFASRSSARSRTGPTSARTTAIAIPGLSRSKDRHMTRRRRPGPISLTTSRRRSVVWGWVIPQRQGAGSSRVRAPLPEAPSASPEPWSSGELFAESTSVCGRRVSASSRGLHANHSRKPTGRRSRTV